MTSLDSNPLSRLELERRVGGLLVGWHARPSVGAQGKAGVTIAGERRELPLRAVVRDDVVRALGLEDSAPGFELALPWQVWRDVVRDAGAMALDIQGVAVAATRLTQVLGQPTWPEQEPLGHVESRQGLQLQGWFIPAQGRPADFSVLVNGHTLRCPAQAIERMDVASAWWLPHAQVGFRVEIPGSIWPQVPAGSDAELQLLADGHAIGGRWTLHRAELASLLVAQQRPADPKEDLAHCLLVFEHLVLSGEWAAQSSSIQRLLSDQVKSAGLDIDPHSLMEAAVVGASAAGGGGVATPRGRMAWLRHAPVAALAWRLLAWLKRRPGQQARALRWEMALTHWTGLFDKALYVSQLDASAPWGGQSPLAHYVTQGDARSLVPNLVLDPRGYTGQLPGRKHPGINRLLHYALYGRFHGLAPGAWFDTAHYLRVNADVRRSGADPVSHFLRFGWQERRSPLPGFALDNEGAHPVLQRLASLAAKRMGQPALNYLLRGLPPGAPVPTHGRLPWMPTVQLEGRDYLALQPWLALARPDAVKATVTIVVPIYAGAQETLRCLWAVLSAPNQTAFELLVVDDCSPEPALSEMLRRLAEAGLLRLLVNERNLGFVRTVNRALAAAGERDVVILNADTCVVNDWLDRMMAHAVAVPKAASITPLSNNATLCSYPHPQADNWQALELSPAEIDLLAARTVPGLRVEAPTGVGFCMFMRHQCLTQIGLLDAERFGRGYGEENDWCMRAMAAGWVNLVVADIFVLHQGAVSFASESSERILAAMALLAERYPDYADRVDAFVKADPLLPARAALDTARLLRADARPRVLLISHARGGGTARRENEEETLLAGQGFAVLRMRPAAQAGCVALVPALSGPQAPNLLALPMADEELILQALRDLRVVAVQLHHLVDFPETLAAALPRWCQSLQAPLTAMLHDYHAVCPRINLVGPDRRYCGEPDEAGCLRCLAQDEAGRQAGDIVPWRQRHDALLAQAQSIVVPDEDVQQRMQRYFPALNITVQPHQALEISAASPARPVGRVVPHVMVVGAMGVIKGYDVLLRLARSTAWRESGAQLSLLGYSMDDDALREAGIQVLGRYRDDTLVDRLRTEAPDWVWLPSIWPETYCYVLSAVLEAGCRVAVFDIGAQARRLRELKVPALILPMPLSEQPEQLARALLAAQS